MFQRLTLGAHLGNALVLHVRHIPEHGEYDEAGQEAGEEVYRAGQYGVPVTVVVELVVTGQSEQCAESRAQREKHLRCRIDPHLRNTRTLHVYTRTSKSKVRLAVRSMCH